jgi:TFIIF-interacting CTD phosphatase-like protein
MDNTPDCYFYQPTNALPITSWYDDLKDTELLELIPFLDQLATSIGILADLKTFRYKRSIQHQATVPHLHYNPNFKPS